MRNLELSWCNLIRSLKLKIGQCDPLKVKLDSFEVQGCILHMLPPGVYNAHVIAKLIKLGHTDLIK